MTPVATAAASDAAARHRQITLLASKAVRDNSALHGVAGVM